ncbi:MAG: TIGR01906 family membrane protein [Oscillospiraceae bacterium]
MQKKKRITALDIPLALVVVLLLFSLAVVLTLAFRPLYYRDITALDIPGASGFSAADIRANYDALIDYNSLFYRGALHFPTLPMSEAGRIHFAEVKNIFDAIQVLLLVALPLAAVGAIWQLRKKRPGFLLLAGILSLALPAVAGLVILASWENFFVLFHRLAFNNDYWIFDAATDPVILQLPDTFFLHCALLIIALVVVGSAALLVAYALLRRRHAKAGAGPDGAASGPPKKL